MRATRMFQSASVVLAVSLSVLFVSCASDDPTLPPAPVEDPTTGFTISDPEVGRVYVWGGNGFAGAGAMGKMPGYTSLYWPTDVGFDPAGEPVVLDWNNHRVLGLDGSGKFARIVGNGFVGEPVDGPASQCELNHPTHVTFTPAGDKMILSAWHNTILMEMDVNTRYIKRMCGTGGRCYNTETEPLLTCLDLPVCALFHPFSGELYISDQGNQIIRKIDSTGQVQVVAGTAPTGSPGSWQYQFGYEGDDGPATSATLHFERGQVAFPSGKFCFDAAGNLYIADTTNNAVRVVYPDGTIDTFAGMGPFQGGYFGDGGLATAAKLSQPRDVAADADGNVFIADTGNSVIRMVDTNGVITTVVGVLRVPIPPNPNVDPISVDQLHAEHGVPALEVHLSSPRGVEVDADGNLWIADTLNNVVRVYYR